MSGLVVAAGSELAEVAVLGLEVVVVSELAEAAGSVLALAEVEALGSEVAVLALAEVEAGSCIWPVDRLRRLRVPRFRGRGCRG